MKKNEPEEKMVNSFAKFVSSLLSWTREEDRQLTSFLNERIESSNENNRKGIRDRQIQSPSHRKLVVSDLSLPKTRNAKIESRYGRLLIRSIDDIQVRAAVIQAFNSQLEHIIPFLNLIIMLKLQ